MREFDLIRRITDANPSLPGSVVIPPGDDMAMLRWADDDLLVAVDQVINKVHFDLGTAPLELIGRKAVTRNVSDVAAMAAVPVATLCAAILPRKMPGEQCHLLFDAIRQAALDFGCPLIGGDTATHDGPLTLSVTILARPDGIAPITRTGASVGDPIYVTGQLGGSLRGDKPRHLTFEPRVQLARTLAGNADTRPSAMIDLSDGLARDITHLLHGHGAELIARDIPVSAEARRAATQDGRPGWLHAVNDGEDYELLFTAPPQNTYPDAIDGVRITRIGKIIDRPGRVVIIDGDDHVAIQGLGWEHHG